MKNLLLITIVAAVASCANPADTKRIASIVDLALDSAVRRNVITAQDAAEVRAAESIVLEPEPVTAK